MSSISHNRTPWTKLTRYGIPEFRVVRRSLLFNGQTVEIGQQLPANIREHRNRTKQLYEQRLIEPITETVMAAPAAGQAAKMAKPVGKVKAKEVKINNPTNAASAFIPDVTTAVDEADEVEEVIEEVYGEPVRRARPVVRVPATRSKANKR